jgi:hypothetical protein
LLASSATPPAPTFALLRAALLAGNFHLADNELLLILVTLGVAAGL